MTPKPPYQCSDCGSWIYPPSAHLCPAQYTHRPLPVVLSR